MIIFTKQRKHSNVRNLSISWPVESNRETVDNKEPIVAISPTDSESRRSSDCSEASFRLMNPNSWSSTESTPRGLSLASAPRYDRDSISSCTTTCSSHEGFESPDELPSNYTLTDAGNISIFDADGNSRPFKSLYEGPLAIGEQQLVIFIRHFFCGACQSYLRALSNAISLKTYFTLPTPTSITIIGLGDPALIPTYRALTNTPFPIYTDPTRRLHKMLDMGWSLNFGKRAKYTNNVNEAKWIAGQLSQMKHLEEKQNRFKGGAWWWIGGEFLIRDGKVIWCHRMRNYRDHAEMDVVKRLLHVDAV